jgi:hypothetical protein
MSVSEGEMKGILSRQSCASSLVTLCALLVILEILGQCQLSSVIGAEVRDESEKERLTLFAEYKHNILEHLSSDGRLVVLYQTTMPTRTYSYRSDSGKVKPDQPEVYEDALRVVELENGREIGRIRTEFLPDNVQFVPETQNLFFREPKRRPEIMWQFNMWDFSKGKVEVCSKDDATGFRSITFLDQQRAVGVLWEENKVDSLIKLTLPNCKRTIIGPVNPAIPGDRLRAGPLPSPDKRFLVYTLGSNEAVIWDTAKRQIANRLSATGLFFTDKLAYTSDGKFLIISAATKLFGGEGAKNYLLVYNTKTYQLVRQLEIPKVDAITVSPDSKTIAIGYKKEERKTFSMNEQAYIALYDLATGEQVAAASHPAVKQQRSDPGVAKITRLAFTPDGKYLLSSTYDTRVWRVD